MTKSVREFILSLILVIYSLVMMIFYKEEFNQSFPIIYILLGCYFGYNSLSIYIRSLNEFRGAKKPFKYNYNPSTKQINKSHIKQDNQRALIILLLYFIPITLVGWYISKNYSESYVFLLFVFINLGDYICVLFWCPFKTIFLKNKCCVTCRITNWDRLMKFWILLFIPNIVSYVLFSIGLFIFIHWEVAIYSHPERFYEASNESLRCYHCDHIKCKK